MLDVFSNSDALFYKYYDETHTYIECYENMQKLNSVLFKFKKTPVALYVSKNFYAYCAIFSILLSENPWIPLSPAQPEKRLLDIIEISKPGMIIADDKLPDIINQYAEKNNILVYSLSDVLNKNAARQFELGQFDENDIAYIMFTSGSTGVPKGVPMTHKNYINFIENAMKILPFEKKEVFSDYHDFGFDISIFYLFCAVLTESAFAPVIKKAEQFCPLDNLIANKVTVWSSVPSVISQIKTLRPNVKIESSIKIMFLCGEPFSLAVLKYCYENMELINVYNFYGLTETGVENFYHRCKIEDIARFESQGFVPIGKPLDGNEIMLTEEGELLLSGCQVTPGYLGGIGKERFNIIDGKRWYHTGDIVKKFEDVHFCKGRLDSQIKFRGFRVELMDIEVNIRLFPDVEDAVCFAESNENEITQLISVIKTQKEIDYGAVKSFLKEKLPVYMIPKQCFFLKEFPVNNNGKVDRKKIISLVKGN